MVQEVEGRKVRGFPSRFVGPKLFARGQIEVGFGAYMLECHRCMFGRKITTAIQSRVETSGHDERCIPDLLYGWKIARARTFIHFIASQGGKY